MGNDNRSITTQDRKISIVFNTTTDKQERYLDVPLTESKSHDDNSDETLEIFSELDEMIGLEEVKEIIFQIYAMLKIQKIRKEEGLQVNSHVYHMMFKGNPGTGKTTVARIIGKLFRSMGLLSKGHLLEVERADLVGEYIGHTAQKTRDLIKKALGGVLFIDEAYSLARGGEKDFGKEAIDCLVKGMEDFRNEFILILAGYPSEMDDFLSSNSGLPSRFPMHVEFPDYSVDELLKITYKMAFEREYIILPEAVAKIKELISKEKTINFNFSNARYVRNILERAMRNQAVRLVKNHKGKMTHNNLKNLVYEDFLFYTKQDAYEAQDAFNTL
ncbi:AAA family ATPase [Paenibacillus sp. 481]|uniref:AAA family ATPase n=1 Tax=Paenibacillus sp. 481 TaxID=2835869 RepID=UPI001E4A2CB1|nr:AAA family ATPase [Paenibacillus sp. 481]UHA76242.1 AAA family ATPase [Paenibacillus sp. 481]